MTTTVKPLPPHGTPSRARGRFHDGIARCSCRPCRDAENRYNKRRRFLTATGQSLTTDAEPVTQHLRQIFASGAGWEQTATAAACSKATLSKLLHGQQPKIRRALAERLLSIPVEAVAHERVPASATGSIRKVRALMAIGHPCTRIRQEAGLDRTVICQLVNAQTESVLASTTHKVNSAYRRLSEQSGPSVRNRNRALREHWAPPAAWDDDTIDNPAAHPEWTGYCGTDRGYWTHRSQQLPMCDRCATAHQEWLAERAELDNQERNRQQFAARAAASHREADLADDTRELMRISGLDYQQAADRLGVTRQHLQQALVRHPEPLKEAA